MTALKAQSGLRNFNDARALLRSNASRRTRRVLLTMRPGEGSVNGALQRTPRSLNAFAKARFQHECSVTIDLATRVSIEHSPFQINLVFIVLFKAILEPGA